MSYFRFQDVTEIDVRIVRGSNLLRNRIVERFNVFNDRLELFGGNVRSHFLLEDCKHRRPAKFVHICM